VAALWVLSDLGFYFLLPALGVTPDYSENGMAVALFYSYWIGLAVVLLWPVYATWEEHARWPTFQRPAVSALVWTLFYAGAVIFVGWVMPNLPPFESDGLTNPPDLPQADPWYFLPKSVDILFQQLLVVALVLSLTGAGQSLRRVSLTCGGLFGVSHLLLLLGGAPIGYVVRFTIMATVFGFLFPLLLLRVRNGLAYSYMLHWMFYAGALIIARVDILA
jgi:hypothetical protein